MVNIEFRELNNKSRKGTYIYIKEKNKRGVYLKYVTGSPIDAYRQYYVDRYVKKKKQVSIKKYVNAYSNPSVKRTNKSRNRVNRQVEQYLGKLKRSGRSINSSFKKGISQASISDRRQLSSGVMRNASRELLSSLVLDKDLLDILTSSENMRKLKMVTVI